MRDDPVFEEYFRDKSEKDGEDDDDNRPTGFETNFECRDDQDPLRMSEKPNVMKYHEVLKQVKERTEEIRKNYDNSNFLSDYGSPDRPMSEVKVSYLFTYRIFKFEILNFSNVCLVFLHIFSSYNVYDIC
jgi:hypothetical protein